MSIGAVLVLEEGELSPTARPIEYIVTEKGCWECVSHKANDSGYVVLHRGNYVLAHRYSYGLFFGFIEDGLVGRHVCDNTLCINPHHILAGTQLDNIRDMYGRERDRHSRGREHRWSKITEEDVEAIRSLHRTKRFTLQQLADMFRLSHSGVQSIVYNRCWKHVE